MNSKNTKTLLGISIAAILAISVFSVIGVQKVAADDDKDDGKKIWKFFKKFTKRADFVAKMNTAQIPEADRPTDREKTGMAKFNFNKDSSKLEYTLMVNGLDLAGLATESTDDDVTKIHFHAAPPLIAGDHVLNVLLGPCEDDLEMSYFAQTGKVTGAWDDSDVSNSEEKCRFLGSIPGPAGTSKSLTSQLEALCTGEVYVNVHTTHGPAGEIRGQVEPTKHGKKICEELLG